MTTQSYTLAEVSSILRVHRQTLVRWIRDGRLLAFKAGSQWRVPREAVEEIMRPVA